MTDNPSNKTSAETAQKSATLATTQLADIQPGGYVSQLIERPFPDVPEKTTKLKDWLRKSLTTIRAAVNTPISRDKCLVSAI
jgi:hypothetical protein